MASCKDCVHVEVCTHFAKMILDSFNVSEDDAQDLLKKCNGDASVCNDFADRSRFAEIPSTVYTTIYGDVSKIELLGYFGEDKRKQCVTVEPLHFKEKIVFLTGEEAEQALQEKRQ